MFILNLPYYLLTIAAGFAVVRNMFFNDDRWFAFFNLDRLESTFGFMPVVYVNLVLAVFGAIFFNIPFVSVGFFLVFKLYAFYWLYDAWKQGKIRNWIRWMNA